MALVEEAFKITKLPTLPHRVPTNKSVIFAKVELNIEAKMFEEVAFVNVAFCVSIFDVINESKVGLAVKE